MKWRNGLTGSFGRSIRCLWSHLNTKRCIISDRAKGINVNTIAPGYMATDLTSSLWEVEKGKKLRDSFPRRRLMSIDALDPMLLYLCSDASRSVTGGLFAIDDGQTL